MDPAGNSEAVFDIKQASASEFHKSGAIQFNGAADWAVFKSNISGRLYLCFFIPDGGAPVSGLLGRHVSERLVDPGFVFVEPLLGRKNIRIKGCQQDFLRIGRRGNQGR